MHSSDLDHLNFHQLMLPAPLEGGFRMEGYWVWCGSVVKGEDNKYHMFASRWPKTLPMHPGWLAASEIVRAVSDTPEGPYTFQEVVLERRSPAYWDGRATHNPVIIKHEDHYLLYYMGTTHPFTEPVSSADLPMCGPIHITACANQRIGLAISKSVYGPWERFDEPILTTRPDHFDSFLVNNQSPVILPDHQVIMMYKSRAYHEDISRDFLYTGMQFGMAKAPHYRGPYEAVTENELFDSSQLELEDPFIWQDPSGTFCMIAKDMDGRICGEPRGGVVATSPDALHWTLHKNQLAYSRNILWSDGVTRTMGNLERPFILFEEGQPTHMFFATSDGIEGLSDCENTWNMVIPLKTTM